MNYSCEWKSDESFTCNIVENFVSNTPVVKQPRYYKLMYAKPTIMPPTGLLQTTSNVSNVNNCASLCTQSNDCIGFYYNNNNCIIYPAAQSVAINTNLQSADSTNIIGYSPNASFLGSPVPNFPLTIYN